MSPVKTIQSMSDAELSKIVVDAHSHVKSVHNITKDHADFDKFLAMHPYYKDAVDEFKLRKLDLSPVPLTDESLPSETIIGDKANPSADDLAREKAAIQSEEPTITDQQLSEESRLRQEERKSAPPTQEPHVQETSVADSTDSVVKDIAHEVKETV